MVRAKGKARILNVLDAVVVCCSPIGSKSYQREHSVSMNPEGVAANNTKGQAGIFHFLRGLWGFHPSGVRYILKTVIFYLGFRFASP